MKQKVFTVFDEKAGAYLPPFYFNTEGQAKRAMIDCVTDKDHHFARHPADYTLFCLGEFDNISGEFTTEKRPLGNLLEYRPVDKVTPLFPETEEAK